MRASGWLKTSRLVFGEKGAANKRAARDEQLSPAVAIRRVRR